MKRILAFVLCLCMVFSMLPVRALASADAAQPDAASEVDPTISGGIEDWEDETEPAEETTEAPTTEVTEAPTTEATEEPTGEPTTEATEEPTTEGTEPPVQIVMGEGAAAPDGGLPDNDTLFAGYAERVFYGNNAVCLNSAAGDQLTGDEKLVYDAMASMIRKIANGEETDTVIGMGRTITYGNTTYVADVELSFSTGTFSNEVLGRIMDALLADLPYDLYWYDKVTGCRATWFSGSTLVHLSIEMTVADNYKGADDYTTDPDKTGAAVIAAANAAQIVEKYAGSTDYQKLVGFKNEICSRVSYDFDAADGGYFSQNNNPWQLINVFDGDSSTNVVCEGYSKAFMYLCGQSDFAGDVECHTVTGVAGGPHMWNIVSIGGKHYMADVTNSDSGMIGQDGGLFLSGAEGSVENGYLFEFPYKSLLFTYDQESLALWGTGEDSILHLSENDYGPNGEVLPAKVESITIMGDSDGKICLNISKSLYAKVLPENAENPMVEWSVENGTGEATINEYGFITGTKCGTVTVRAAAVDGSGVVGEKTLEIIELSLVVTGPDQVRENTSERLWADFVPAEYGGRINWRLENPEDAAYVTLGNSTLYNGYEDISVHDIDSIRTVTVVAYSEEFPGVEDRKTLTLIPNVDNISVHWDAGGEGGDYLFTGLNGSITVDINHPEFRGDILLQAWALPEEVGGTVSLQCSDTNGYYVTVTENADGSMTVVPTGKLGVVDIQMTAFDDYGVVRRILSINLVHKVHGVEIVPPDGTTHIRGGATVNLKANVGEDVADYGTDVLWSLADESVPYATINAKGKLTTRAVSEPTPITVIAALKGNPDICNELEIILHPAVDNVWIVYNGLMLKDNDILNMDMLKGTVDLDAVFSANGCIEEAIWSTGNPNIAVVNEDGVVTFKKPGTVTIYFITLDGSNKLTRVRLKVSNLAETVTLTVVKNELRPKESTTLSAYLQTADGRSPTNKNVTWVSSDPSVATVNAKGKVVAKTVYEKTTVTITAIAKDGGGASASVEITVLPKKASTLGLLVDGSNVSGRTITRNLDGEKTILAVAQLYGDGGYSLPAGAVTYSSSSKGVATIDANGVITMKKPGTTTITAKADGQTVKFTLKVVRFVSGITVTGKTNWLVSGKTLTLKASATGLSGKPTSSAVIWSSSDETVAKVNASGKVTAQKVYIRKAVTITATAKDSGLVSASYTLIVYPLATTVTIVSPDGYVLNNRTVAGYVGGSVQLSAKVYPFCVSGEGEQYGALQNVQWSSSNKKIATVDADGNLTMLRKGTVTIKATATDGSKKTVSFKLIITDPRVI